ncbi:MAG: TIGR00725 family protein [Candidatus Marinimicrobia bacterium]|nr:TIGR00725 family protein [Candidatus Neomarinimicrobiota bacterium]MBT3618569.1 TIGR00725 family protein [Candidatus Neomarinimicrobiota bacterium]MBT3828796.1 TIGR00725 family protein [Candidatus Neomarinimicrobiota bacterium]MBT3996842.1 TIGR00725 family protein [Candidatus Neomarinimicrobiota bacterium]MBT4281007.1 TIGR00725 family protein [Candidatus Neomarinimicrobiota bacterium]
MKNFTTRVSVFGGRNITDEVYSQTVELGKSMAEEGYLVFCGGGSGVMEAIAKGVNEGGGTCVGILKDGSLEEANEFISLPITTGLGIYRNLMLAYNCDIAVAISGEYGTLSEIAYALQLEKPVIGFHTWDIPKVNHADSPSDVIKQIKEHI